MKRHLSEEEIAGWVMGVRAAALVAHVDECEACRVQTAALQRTLSEFGRATREWAAASTPAIPAMTVRRWWQPSVEWLALAAGLTIMASIPVYRIHRAQVAARDAAVDAVLLQQVDAEISRAVPGPMEPLVTLVSWRGQQ